MPDTMKYTRRGALHSRVSETWWKLYWWDFWATSLAASLATAAVAVVLAAAHIELQYVAGAAVILFARRIVNKRITIPRPPEERPFTGPVGKGAGVREQKSPDSVEWEIH